MKLEEIKNMTGSFEQRVKQWFVSRKINVGPVRVNDDHTVDYDGNLIITKRPGLPFLNSMPFKLNTVKRDFIASHQAFNDLSNMPSHVGGNVVLNYNTNLKTLQGLSIRCLDSITFASTGITSLHNVHKQILMCRVLNVSNCEIESHLLGVLLIKGLEKFVYNWNYTISVLQDRRDRENGKRGIYPYPYNNSGPMTIIEKYLQIPYNQRDIIEAQQELIDAGFEEYARL